MKWFSSVVSLVVIVDVKITVVWLDCFAKVAFAILPSKISRVGSFQKNLDTLLVSASKFLEILCLHCHCGLQGKFLPQCQCLPANFGTGTLEFMSRRPRSFLVADLANTLVVIGIAISQHSPANMVPGIVYTIVVHAVNAQTCFTKVLRAPRTVIVNAGKHGLKHQSAVGAVIISVRVGHGPTDIAQDPVRQDKCALINAVAHATTQFGRKIQEFFLGIKKLFEARCWDSASIGGNESPRGFQRVAQGDGCLPIVISVVNVIVSNHDSFGKVIKWNPIRLVTSTGSWHSPANALATARTSSPVIIDSQARYIS
mmetsp:Transcript_8004/g.16850  ORF Transcript_8004/g.16850 Transcript_8004/m.16850 type:complete len:313 (+) Transcript_8004:552-1490(+)